MHNANKKWRNSITMNKKSITCIVGALAVCGICVVSLYAAAPVSQNDSFAIEQYTFNEGTSWFFGSRWNVKRSSIGENVIGLTTHSTTESPFYTVFQGFMYVSLYIPPLPDYQYDIDEIQSSVSSGGDIIEEAVWQNDPDPYFYWTLRGVGLEVLGYSLSFNEYPDEFVDVVNPEYQTPEMFLGDGKHTFYVVAKNTAGDFGSVGHFEVWVDTTRPSISNTLPDNGATTSNPRPTIQAIVFDELSGIDVGSIVLTITTDLDSFTTAGTYDPDTGLIFFVPDDDFPEGIVTVRLEVSDLADNDAVASFWSFTVSTTAPDGWVLINDDAPVSDTPEVHLRIFASEVLLDIEDMILSNDGVFDTEVWEPYTTVKENWMLPMIAGTRTVYIKFRDSAGVESEIFSDAIVLLLATPDTFIATSPPSVTTDTTAVFSFTTTIPGSSFQYKLDNGGWCAFTTDSTATFSGLADGNHYFQVRAGIDLDNSGTIDSDEIDGSPAVVSWTVGALSAVPHDAEQPIRYYQKE